MVLRIRDESVNLTAQFYIYQFEIDSSSFRANVGVN